MCRERKRNTEIGREKDQLRAAAAEASDEVELSFVGFYQKAHTRK